MPGRQDPYRAGVFLARFCRRGFLDVAQWPQAASYDEIPDHTERDQCGRSGAEFEVDQAQVVKDVKRFSEELTDKGLIEVTASVDE